MLLEEGVNAVVLEGHCPACRSDEEGVREILRSELRPEEAETIARRLNEDYSQEIAKHVEKLALSESPKVPRPVLSRFPVRRRRRT